MSPQDDHDPLRTADHDAHPTPAALVVTATFAQGSLPSQEGTISQMPGEATESKRAAGSVSVPGYKIEGVLGRGGMGVVYKASHLALKRTVALKMVLAGGHADRQELARFRVEAEAVARLVHPNIVQIHEVGESDGRPYCALEFVEGGNLATKIAGKPIPSWAAAKLVETLARAMQLAHSRNIVHRDLKPANVLLTADGTPKITDFGLARQLDTDSGETKAGAIMGTPTYMAPEQASGHSHDAGPAADIYALGVILYECLTGRPPFKGGTVIETLDQVRTQEPAPPSRWQAKISLDLETICLKCLRKEPEKRYASAGELADDLLRFQRGEPILGRPVSRTERAVKWMRRNKVVTGLLAVVALAVAAGAVGTYSKYLEAKEQEAKVEKKNDELIVAIGKLERTNEDLKTAETLAKKNAEAALQGETEAKRQKTIAEGARAYGARETYWTKLQLAAGMVKRGELDDVSKILWDTPKELRGWEWGYLLAHCPLPDWTLKAHQGPALDLVASADGQMLVTAGADGFVRAWNAGTTKLVWEHQAGLPVRRLALDPKGRFVVAAAGKGLSVLSAKTGELLHTLKQERGSGYLNLMLTGDGARLYACRLPLEQARYEYSMIDTKSWTILPRKFESFEVGGSLDAGGKYFVLQTPVAGQAINQLGWRNADDYKFIDQERYPGYFTRFLDLALDTRQNYLVVLEESRAAFFELNGRALSKRSEFQTRARHPLISTAVDFQAGHVALLSREGEVRICNRKGELLAQANHGEGGARIVAVGGGRFISAGRGGTIKAWSLAHMKSLTTMESKWPTARSLSARNVALAADGRTFAAQTGEPQRFVLGDPSQATLVEGEHFGNHFFFLGFTDDRILLTLYHRRQIQPKVEAEIKTWFMAFAADGRADPWVRAVPLRGLVRSGQAAAGNRLIVAYLDKDVDIFDLAAWKPFPRVVDKPAQVVALSRDGAQAAAVIEGQELIHWEVASGMVLGRVSVNLDRPVKAVFHPHGEALAIGDEHGGITVWNLPLSDKSIRFQHSAAVTGLRFSPDGQRLITSSADNSLRIWDWRLGRDLLAVEWPHTLFDVDVSKDGQTLASTSFQVHLQFRRALPWNFDEDSPAFRAALASRRAREEANKIVKEWQSQGLSGQALNDKAAQQTNITPAVLQAITELAFEIASRSDRHVKLDNFKPRSTWR